MSGSNGTTLVDIEGVVASVNDHGLKLQGEADWRNFSKYAAPGAIAPVTAGTPVLISLDKSNFVRVLSPMGEAPAPHASPAPSQHAPDKDTLIVRQSSVKAAVDYLNHSRRDYTVAELLSTAAELEQWVNR